MCAWVRVVRTQGVCSSWAGSHSAGRCGHTPLPRAVECLPVSNRARALLLCGTTPDPPCRWLPAAPPPPPPPAPAWLLSRSDSTSLIHGCCCCCGCGCWWCCAGVGARGPSSRSIIAGWPCRPAACAGVAPAAIRGVGAAAAAGGGVPRPSKSCTWCPSRAGTEDQSPARAQLPVPAQLRAAGWQHLCVHRCCHRPAMWSCQACSGCSSSSSCTCSLTASPSSSVKRLWPSPGLRCSAMPAHLQSVTSCCWQGDGHLASHPHSLGGPASKGEVRHKRERDTRGRQHPFLPTLCVLFQAVVWLLIGGCSLP